MSYSNMPATSFEASQQIKQIKFNHDMYLYIVSNNGHFPFDQKCWFQFLVKTSDTRNLRRAFPGVSGKKRTLPRKKKQIFENFFLGNSVPFDFLPGMPICLSRKSTIFGFSGNFLGTLSYHLPLFWKFQKFWLNGKQLLSIGDTDYK